MRAADCASLRAELRVHTDADHEALDAEMRQVGWSDRASYGRFLQIQHAARLPIERWALGSCPDEICPPRQAHLIESDLAALDLSCETIDSEFALPEGANPIGLAWAIAGSSLGNRAILRDVKRGDGDRADAGDLPSRFLSDRTMTEFWQGLRPRLERPVSLETLPAAAMAAKQVFDHFRSITRAMTGSGRAL